MVSINTTFFPATPANEQASTDAMLAAPKHHLAHLQTLQLQQQQVLQQMSHGNNVVAPQPSVTAKDGRDDRLVQFPTVCGTGVTEACGGASRVSFSFDQNHTMFTPGSHPHPPVEECDYDTNPTELYVRVQWKDWDGASARASTDPHEAGTWVSRKEADGRLRWRLLPLHAAVIFRAPQTALVTLLCAFAPGAACKDDTGALPLHLALRNGCDPEVLHLLLLAYPQGADVPDRKGRTPLALARQSQHANREAYVRALERGSAYYAVANAASLAPFPHPSNLTHYQRSPPSPLSTTRMPALQITTEPATPFADQAAHSYAMPALTEAERMAGLEAELAKTQETSQVLFEYVNSLEAQLASRNDTERFLATKVAHLDAQVKESNAELEAAEREVEAKRDALASKENERVRIVEAEVAALKAALADKKDAELKSYRLTNNETFTLQDRATASERERAAAQANTAVLEAQLAQRIATEQSLAAQVSTLASQLASSAGSSSDAAGAYERRCAALDDEQGKLKGRVAELRGKLGMVADKLDAMAGEQVRIMAAATRHEGTMASCAKAHEIIVQDTTHQETLLEDAAKEREQIVSILMRQAEDAERTVAEREKTLQAVKEQEADIRRCEQERDNVVTSVNKQREYMNFMLNGELSFLKKVGSKDEKESANEKEVEDAVQSQSEDLSQRAVMPIVERAVSPASTEAGLAAAITEATGDLEAPVAEEGELDQAPAVAAAFRTIEKPDDVAAATAGAGGDEPTGEGETAQAESREETEVANDANEKTTVAAIADEEEAADEGDIDERDTTTGMSAEEIEDIALEEAVQAIKEAMQAAESSVKQDVGEYDDDSLDDDESEAGATDHTNDTLGEEEEEVPEDKEEAHEHVDLGNYGTPASQEDDEEETTSDTVLSTASSDDGATTEESIDPPQEEDTNDMASGAAISTASSDEDGNGGEPVDPLLEPPSSVE